MESRGNLRESVGGEEVDVRKLFSRVRFKRKALGHIEGERITYQFPIDAITRILHRGKMKISRLPRARGRS